VLLWHCLVCAHVQVDCTVASCRRTHLLGVLLRCVQIDLQMDPWILVLVLFEERSVLVCACEWRTALHVALQASSLSLLRMVGALACCFCISDAAAASSTMQDSMVLIAQRCVHSSCACAFVFSVTYIAIRAP
jgi:hypothetical protein